MMSREEFLAGLRQALALEVSERVVQDNLSYYADYIEEECRKGRTEGEVLEELGDPRLLARTIISASSDAPGSTDYHQEAGEQFFSGDTDGLHASYTEQSGWDIRYKKWKLNTWYGKLAMAVIGIVLILVVLSILSGLFVLAMKILVPVCVILLMYYFIKNLISR